MAAKHTFSSSIAFLFILSALFSCSKKDFVLACGDDSLFSMEEVTGEMIYLPCYDSWAVKIEQDSQVPIIAASLDIPDYLKVEGLPVVLSGCFYDFDLPLILPDPAPWGDMYVVRDFLIEIEED